MQARQLAEDWWYIIRETLAISFPTVGEALTGQVTVASCDRRLDHWSRRLVDGARATLCFSGRDAIDWSRAYVIMSNHQSIFDIPVLFQSVPGTMRMVTKAELFSVPVWGRAMRDAGFIAIDRSNRSRAIASLKVAAQQINQGTHVWIAPEGTRARDRKIGPLKKGGFMLALETGAPILPVFLDGSYDVLRPDHWRINKDVAVDVRFGTPIDVSGKTCDQLMADVRGFFDASGRPAVTRVSRSAAL
jgi:1-acyl-sn-glycerol-3-phosphate acyltransferase